MKTAPDEHLEHIRRCKDAVGIPVIASLNGTTESGWIRYAEQMQQAAADALELNMYLIPVNPNIGSSQVERSIWIWYRQSARG